MADILENAEANLTPMMRNLINTLWGEWKTVEQQIGDFAMSWADLRCRGRLFPHPSDFRLGPFVETAIVAAAATVRLFADVHNSGRSLQRI